MPQERSAADTATITGARTLLPKLSMLACCSSEWSGAKSRSAKAKADVAAACGPILAATEEALPAACDRPLAVAVWSSTTGCSNVVS